MVHRFSGKGLIRRELAESPHGPPRRAGPVIRNVRKIVGFQAKLLSHLYGDQTFFQNQQTGSFQANCSNRRYFHNHLRSVVRARCAACLIQCR
jgi:hypothetical protein